MEHFFKKLKLLKWEAGFLEFSSGFAINCMTFDNLLLTEFICP